MEYYSAFKKKEILTQAITWVNLKGIMLSEISQFHKKDKILYDCMYIRCLELSNSYKQKVERWFQGRGVDVGEVDEGPILIPVPSVVSRTEEAESGREVTQKDGFLGLTMLIHNNNGVLSLILIIIMY